MHIQPDVVVEEDCPPGLICIFLEDNKYEVNDKFCRLFIRDRVIPPNRQNIGQILREIGEEYYHECFMLKYHNLHYELRISKALFHLALTIDNIKLQ